MDYYVSLNEQHQILLCRKCKSAVRPHDGIESHFRQQHQLKGEVLKDIINYFSCMRLNDPTTIELPGDGTPAIPLLRTSNGYCCTGCRYLTTARDNITRHWREAGHTGEGDRWTEVQVQTWLGRRYARYWIVCTGNEGNKQKRKVTLVDSAMERMIAESEVELNNEDATRLRKGDLEEDIDRDSSWVKRVGWVRHFGSRDLMDVFDAAEWVNAKIAKSRTGRAVDEDAARERVLLERLGQSFDREIDRCCMRLDSVPVETLQWLASISTTSPNGVPFGRKQKESSMSKYRSVGHRYLSFCWRAHRIGREKAFEKWAICFTDEQWRLLCDMVVELENDGFYGSQRRAGAGSERSDDDEEGLGNGRDNTINWQNGELDRAVFLFIMASIKDRVGGNAYKNPLLCFCAALGITQRPLGYTEPYLYTGMLAAVMWWSRIFFLEAMFEGHTRELDALGVEAVINFRDEHAVWMCVGTHTVMSTITGWMAFGKGWRQRMGGQPSIRWADDGEALFHSGERISIKSFTKAARNLVTEAEGLLDQMVGGSWDKMRQEISMEQIDDSPIRLGAGQSFATNRKNDWLLEPGPGKVMRLVGPSVWDAARNRWKRDAARRWLRLLKLFREALLALTHMWGGQPGRGPETTTMRHCDSWQLIRNVFVLDGQVMLVTDRDKMKAIRDNGRKVARFLPDRIGRMMVAYIAWLLPFERMVRRKCGFAEPKAEQHEFLWRDSDSRTWETDRLSRVMARVMKSETGASIGVGRYRPIAIEMGRRIRGLVARQLDVQMEDDDDNDDNVEIDLVTGEPIDCGGSWNIIWDLQSTHGTRIARQHYAVQIGFPGKLQPEMIASYKEISRLWHQFLEGDDGGNGGTKRKRDQAELLKRARLALEAAATTSRRQAKAGGTEAKEGAGVVDHIAAGLGKLVGKGASWRSAKQEESMRAIAGLKEGGESAICVLPTGAGKSILFMLPAVMRDTGTSMVVVPFSALIDDLVTRATVMGVDCIKFETSLSAGRDSLPRAARLVVISADAVTGAEFTAYADGLVCAGLLQRIFIDECHTVITDINYRPRLGKLKELHRYGCPLIMLTATLPVVLEDWFRKEMLVQGAVAIRDRTTKANCRYKVEQVKAVKGAIEDRVMEIVRQLSAQMVGNQKGVVYCRSKEQCEETAAEIGCDFHHTGIDDEKRMQVRTAWAEGRGHRWITATVGLGTGIDVEGIVAVVHADWPYGLVGFVQQTGRGGRRAGEVVKSFIVHNGRQPRKQGHEDFVQKNDRLQMEAFISTPGCRRAVVSAFMDGVAGETCEDVAGAELCDGCLAGEEAAGEGDGDGGGRNEAVWTRYSKEEGMRVRTLFRWLEEVADECPVCHVRRYYRGLEADHVPDCPRHEDKRKWCEQVAGESYKEVRQKIRFGPLACCFKCKLPLDWCEQAREGLEGSGCVYMDKVLPVVLMGLKSWRVKRLIQKQFDVDPNNPEEFFQWIGMNRQFHGKKGTNGLALWEEIIWEAYKGGRYWFSVII